MIAPLIGLKKPLVHQSVHQFTPRVHHGWREKCAIEFQPRRSDSAGLFSLSKRHFDKLKTTVILSELRWFLWQREKDSNPHIRSQSPLCYLYTIPLCSDEQKLLYRFSLVCQQFFRALLPFIFTSIFPTTAAGVPTAPQRGISTHIRCPLR